LVLDIVETIARVILHLPEDIPTLQVYQSTKCKWRVTCREYDIDSARLRKVIKYAKRDYNWLKHISKNGRFYPFSFRETITFIVKINLNFYPEDRNLILALHYCHGNIDEVVAQSDGVYSRAGIYRFLAEKIKKPYLSALGKGSAA